MSSSDLTQFEIEKILSQKVQHLYSQWAGNSIAQVNCHASLKTITILVEKSLSPTERLLIDSGEIDAAIQWRSKLENLLQSHLRSAIETELKMSILDILVDTSQATERTGFIVVLERAAKGLVESKPV